MFSFLVSIPFANRAKVPPRPAGQRTEPEPNTTFQGFGFGDGGFQMSLGIGAFPFGIFTSTFNFGGNPRSQSMNICNLNNFSFTSFFNPPSTDLVVIFLSGENLATGKLIVFFLFGLDTSAHLLQDEDQFLSKAFLWVTILFLAWLILA